MKSSFSYELPIRPSISLTEVSFITSRIKQFLGDVLGFLKNRSQAIFVVEILNTGPEKIEQPNWRLIQLETLNPLSLQVFT